MKWFSIEDNDRGHALRNDLDFKGPCFGCRLDQRGTCTVLRIVTGFLQSYNEQGSQW